MAYEIIVDLTSDPNYAAEMLALGIQAERNGKTPFLEGKPISLVNVKNSLERWRRVTKIVPDQSLQEERKDEPIPPIFINWGTASKMQWGHPKKKFYENEMEIPFDINAFIDPYKIISA